MILEQTLDAIMGVSREILILVQIMVCASAVLAIGFIVAAGIFAQQYFNEKDEDIFDSHYVQPLADETETRKAA